MEESKKEYIFRLKDKTSNFTIIYNNCLQDNTISWQAKGLFSYLMTLPNDWEIHKTELVSHSSNGRDATLKAFDELIEKGYITVEEIKGECGQFSKKIYRVFEESQGEVKIEHKKRKAKSTVTEKPLTENQERKTSNGNPLTENQELLNTDKQKTNTNNLYSSPKTSENEPPRFSDFSNKEKKSTRSKKTYLSAEEKHKQYLSSLPYDLYSLSEKCADKLVNYLITLQNSRTPAENKLAWQEDFARFLAKENKPEKEILTIIDHAMTGWWKDKIASAKGLLKEYGRFYQQIYSSTSNQKSDYQKRKESDLERGNMDTGKRDYSI